MMTLLLSKSTSKRKRKAISNSKSDKTNDSLNAAGEDDLPIEILDQDSKELNTIDDRLNSIENTVPLIEIEQQPAMIHKPPLNDNVLRPRNAVTTPNVFPQSDPARRKSPISRASTQESSDSSTPSGPRRKKPKELKRSRLSSSPEEELAPRDKAFLGAISRLLDIV